MHTKEDRLSGAMPYAPCPVRGSAERADESGQGNQMISNFGMRIAE
jgi:hypothetical protein